MISIITPSFRASKWLKLCIASVADQKGVAFEHIVQDSCSDDGTQQWLSNDPRVTAFIEKDNGMYDAINRGLRRASGEICAYLNCDEQYLPGALSEVAAAFQTDPEIDVLLAGSLVVDEQSRYICSRPALKPSLRHLRAGRMYNLTSSMFFHARLVHEKKLFFDPDLRVIGDLDWLRRVMEAGAHIETLNLFTSTFADLGTNLALGRAAASEVEAIKASRNTSHRLSDAATISSHRIRRLLAGHYWLRPFSYSIYTPGNDKERHTFHVKKPTGVWHNRL
jgi:glycosyltransferase involved in cell wall biosynthesis